MTASFAEIDIHKYDHLPPEEAIRKAWFDEGSNVLWHEYMQDQIRKQMPLLGRAIERLVGDGNQNREIQL